MDDSRTARLLEIVLRCYPAGWRRRHGDEAAELAALLIRDGTPAGSIAWSYLAGAAREWLTPRGGRRLGTAACALLVAACSLGLSAGLLVSAGPARAAITSQGSAASAALAKAASTSQDSAAPTGAASMSQARTQCQPGTLARVPGVIAAVDRPKMIIGEAGHGRFC
jgi:hypothetical protein